jgi:[acyl-carrier-protein] S-malonyltransferase
MTKRILLFPGQGSQYLGMGKKLSETHAGAKRLLDEANAVLGFDLADIMWNGPEEKLTSTDNTQPALFTVSMMAHAWLKDALKARALSVDYVAGHSLGEYSALCAAGVFSFGDGLRLVRLRGELMAKAGVAKPGAMSAILGLERDKLEEALRTASSSGIVVAANFNSTTQIVISGESGAVGEAERLCTELGAKKVVRLAVSGAFHSPLMDYAVDGLRAGLESVTFAAPSVPVITNVDAQAATDPAVLKESLLRQLTSPVRWVESMQFAAAQGVTEGLEVGAGKVLMGLLRGITRDVKVTPVETPEDLEK